MPSLTGVGRTLCVNPVVCGVTFGLGEGGGKGNKTGREQRITGRICGVLRQVLFRPFLLLNPYSL